MTDIYALIEQVRASYIDAFRAFVNEQHKACTLGAAEVKMQLGGGSKLMGQFYCVDFVCNDEGDTDARDFTFTPYYQFSGLRGQLGDLAVTFTSMRWNDVIITHDLVEFPSDQVSDWFEQWFDPSDQRRDPEAEFSNTIHSLSIEPKILAIDFGTATAEAFWSLANLLEEAGAKSATIRCSE